MGSDPFISELKNVIERAVISSSGERLRFDLADSKKALNKPRAIAQTSAESLEFVTAEEFRQLEKANIRSALEHAGWKIWGVGGAAELLGMKPSTLAYQVRMLGIEKGR